MMIEVDLITGFLGSGKTTFLKQYAKYYMDQGIRIGILENDHGAVNVDMLLLQGLRGENCELEMVAGGCDADCHKRRFKTKLISMAMSGYKRVIVEPSGIFDVDEFFDTLREEPLENWYTIGNVITVVDATSCQNEFESKQAQYYFESQLVNAGAIVMSHTENLSAEEIDEISNQIRQDDNQKILAKDIRGLEQEDLELLSQVGFRRGDFVKRILDFEPYETEYIMEVPTTKKELKQQLDEWFQSEEENVLRVKGFFKEEGKWWQVNAIPGNYQFEEIPVGQEVIIVIRGRS